MHGFIQRMIGAAKLEVPIYEEVEHDHSATGQAAAVVVLASLAAGIGALTHMGFGGLIIVTLAALIGWLIWAAIIWVVGTKLLPQSQTEADLGQLLRTMGFAASPGLLRIFEIIPVLGGIVGIVVAIWMVATMVVAVRQALDYDNTLRAVGVVVIGWIIQLLIGWLIGGSLLYGMGGAPAGAGAV
ncbi:YIP1 family protein [Salinisphaera sp. SPP-AMP-43]|uniref:YIP1 family protein n=1 Tax=Salinisphaera sp. SPP-AMP-43 TaxID=3121288 RepID=UPI003C6E2CCE